MRNQKILLIDTSSILHAVMYSLGKEKLSHEDKPTFVIYGFLFKLRLLLKMSYPGNVVFAVDSRKSLRKKMYPKYKEKRQNKTPEQLALLNLARPQFELIQNELLAELGYKNVFEAEGYEADDVIARICKDYSQCEIDIVSDDKDLYQLLSENIAIIKAKSDVYYTYEDFIEDYNLDPYLWRGVKSIGGCTSDNVQGVQIPDDNGGWSKRGVGEGTALKYLRKELPHHHKSYVAIRSKQGKETIARNKKLVILPFKGTPKFKIMPNRVQLDSLVNICERFGFKSILSDLHDWKMILRAR